MIRRALAAAAILLATGASASVAGSDPYVAAIIHVRSISVPRLLFAPDRQTRAASVEVLLRAQLARRGRMVAATLANGRRHGIVRSVRVLWINGSYAVVARRSFLDALRGRGDVAGITPDGASVHPEGFDWVGLDAFAPVWSDPTTPSDGTGITVAVIDSGLDLSGLPAGRYRGRPSDWFDATATSTTPVDGYAPHGCDGHGTSVAGVVAAGAPGASLIAANIFNSQCSDTVSGTTAALQWALDPDGDPRTPDAPDVVNASWGSTGVVCGTVYQMPLVALRAAGILPVFASGDSGVPDSPASLPEAFAVGGLETATTVAAFSGHGDASACRGSAPFPDVVAPAVGIDVAHRPFLVTNPVAGTSVAAPQVAAALAVLLQRHAGMTADEQAAALRSTAAAIADPGAGYGRLDVAALLATSLPTARDTTAPVLDLPTVIVTRGGRTITITATDAVALAHVVSAVDHLETSFRGATVTTAGPVATVDVPAGLAEGTYPLTAFAVDTVGNVGVLDTAQVIVDRTAPMLSAGLVGASVITANVTEVGSGLASISLALDAGGAVITPASGSPVAVAFDAASLPDGQHVAHLVATDLVGNMSDALDVPFLLDRTPPLVQGWRVTLDRDARVHLAASVGDAATAEWSDGAGAHHPLAIVAGVVAAAVDASGWTPGAHVLSVRGRDAAGNWSAPVAATVVLPLRLSARLSALTIRLGGRATFVAEPTPTRAGTLEVSFLLDADAASVRGCLAVLAVRDRRGRELLRVDLARIGGRLVTRTVRGRIAGAWHPLGRGPRLIDVSLAAAGVASVRLGTTSRSAPSHGTLRLTAYRSWIWLATLATRRR